MKNKVIITCAITGGIHTPTMSPHLPFRPEDIADQAIAAAKAGAAILHLHARRPEDGHPTGDPAIFRQFLRPIHDATDAVINLTTGGSPSMSPAERLAAVLEFEPEMCSLNMGSINFSFHPLASKIHDWRFAWEKQYVETSDDFIFRNTFRDVHRTLELTQSLQTRFEHECYDVGHLYNLAYFRNQGLLTGPIFIQGVFGILGGIGADLDNLVFMRRTAEKLFGADAKWSTLAAGKAQMPMVTHSALMGGHVRVGLEDSLFLERGQLATSNADQVAKIRSVLERLGYEIATPMEARAILGLKGRDKVRIT